jgi:hypothetical protein
MGVNIQKFTKMFARQAQKGNKDASGSCVLKCSAVGMHWTCSREIRTLSAGIGEHSRICSVIYISAFIEPELLPLCDANFIIYL